MHPLFADLLMKYSPFQKSSLHLRPPRARSLSNMDATEEVPETSPEGVLSNVFKLKEFRAGQLKAIESLRDGRDVVVRLSTNGGKSLVYQLFPKLFGDSSCCLVISPLSALMSEQACCCLLLHNPNSCGRSRSYVIWDWRQFA